MKNAKGLFLWLFSATLFAGNAYALNFNGNLISPIAQEISSESGYQLAKSTFLPETFDDLGLSGRENTKYDHNTTQNCSAYKLSSCPENASCASCPFNRKLKKINSCKSGYTLSGNTCVDTEFCRTDASTYKNSIPSGFRCASVISSSVNSDKCYKDCQKISCSAYPLDCSSINKTAMNISSTETCSDCSNTGLSNCAKTFCKITGCANGYKITDNGAECTALDDTCPTNYFKTCDTGTQGEPEYTELGTACYKCKAVPTSLVRTIVGIDAECPTGLSFSMATPEKSTTIHSGSQCYIPTNFTHGSYTNTSEVILPSANTTEPEALFGPHGTVKLSNIPAQVAFIENYALEHSYPISRPQNTTNFTPSLGAPIHNFGNDYDYWILYCGDLLPILYSDLTTSTTLVSGKTPIGIVFDESKKLAIALDEAEKAWSTTHFDIPGLSNTNGSQALNDWNGKTNTQTIVNYCKANSKSCPSAEYAYNYTTIDTTIGDWYLPAAAEAKALYFKRKALNRMLSIVGGTVLQYEGTVLSSSEMDSATPWACCTVNGSDTPKRDVLEIWGTNKVVSHIKTRPIINYGDLNKRLPILYSDMTVSKEIITSKTPIGIVFDEANKKAMALEITPSSPWTREAHGIINDVFSTFDPEKALSDMGGKSNTNALSTYCYSGASASTRKHCTSLEDVLMYSTDGTSPGQWYFSSLGELNQIYQQKRSINATLKAIGREPLEDTQYWSSTRSDGTYGDGSWYILFNQYGGTPQITNFATTMPKIPLLKYPTGMDLMCMGLSPNGKFCGGIDPFAGNIGNYPYCIPMTAIGGTTQTAGTLNNGHTCWACDPGYRLHCYTNSPTVQGCNAYENGECIACYMGNLTEEGKCK